MQIDRVRKYLNQIKSLSELIDEQMRTYNDICVNNQKVCAVINDMPGGHNGSDLSNTIIVIEKEREKLLKIIQDNSNIRVKIIEQINMMRNRSNAALLQAVFVNQISVDEVAIKRKVEKRTIERKLNNALHSFLNEHSYIFKS